MTMIFDTGALIALERNERAMWRRLKLAVRMAQRPRTHGGIVGQAWRNGRRQALMAKALAFLDVASLDTALGKAAGELLAASKEKDVIDASVVLLANDGDQIFTSDIGDLEPLAAASGRHVELIPT
jgi:hypothetical protein